MVEHTTDTGGVLGSNPSARTKKCYNVSTMTEFIKKNFTLFLAFLLPIILIIFVAIVTYFPSISIKTKYNFIYTSCTDGRNYYPYNCNNYMQKRYSVTDDKLFINDVDLTTDSDKNGIPDYGEKYSDRIFLHDTEKNESREISIKEAQAMILNNLLTSPDGVTVSSSYDRRSAGFPFPFDSGHSSYGYYIVKGKSKTKLNLINNTDQYYYQDNFKFIGWVLPGRN